MANRARLVDVRQNLAAAVRTRSALSIQDRVQAIFQALEVVRDSGRQVGVNHHRRKSFVLAKLRKEFVRNRNGNSELTQEPGYGALIRRIGEGEEKAKGDRFGPCAPDPAGKPSNLRCLWFQQDLALSGSSLMYSPAQSPGYQRWTALYVEIVESRPILATDLDQVLESGGGYQSHARTAALD
jgi:hypothetical protein